MKALYVVVFIVSSCWVAQAQNKVDSLKKLIAKTTNDSGKVQAIYAYADAFRLKDAIVFKNYIDKGLALAQKLDYTKGIAEGIRRTGIHYRMQSNYDEGVKYFLKALKVYENLNDKAGIARCYNHLGLIYQRQVLRAAKGDKKIFYEKALAYYNKAKEMYQELEDKKKLVKNYVDLGTLSFAYEEKEKALKIYNEGIKMAKVYKMPAMQADLYLYKGNIYVSRKELSKGFEFMQLAAKKYRVAGFMLGAGIVWVRMGSVYEKQKLYSKSQEYYNKALSVVRKANNKYYTIITLIHLGELYTKIGQYKEADKALKESMVISKSIGNTNTLLRAYQHQIKLDTTQKKLRRAFKDQTSYYKLKDSIFNARKNRQLTEMLTRFDSQKKDSENALLRKDNLLKQKTIRQQYILTIAIVLVLGLVLAFSYSFWKSNQELKTRKDEASRQNDLLVAQQIKISKKNRLLNVQKRQILTQNESLQVQSEELMANKEFLEEKHTLLERTTEVLKEKSTQIKQSLKAGLTIQQAILPSHVYLQRHLSEYFVLYRPKDVVSGDFYWFSVMNEQPLKQMLAVVDCTGHGVPGAFMSLIGHILLDRIVEVEKVTDPAGVLNRLSFLVAEALNQKENNNDDGMDLGILTLERDLKRQDGKVKVTYAGAHRPLFYVENPRSSQAILEEIKGQRRWIGGGVKNKDDFVNQELWLNEGDLVYLSSDGLADQNNKARRKFRKSRLKQVLGNNAHLTLPRQKLALEEALDEHMANTTQRDDILVWGVRV